MDLSKLRSITNNYQEVHLVSLKEWRNADSVEPRDRGGPYMVHQEGYDPQDFKCTPDEFVLGKSGQWMPLGLFFQVPAEQRRQEFVFGTAAEIIALLEALSDKVAVIRPCETGPVSPPPQDDLHAAFLSAKQEPPQP